MIQHLTDEEFSARLNEFRSEAEFLEREACARKLLRCGAALAMAKTEGREAIEFAVPAWKFVRPDGSLGICAWCQKELEVARQPGESHGICPRHSAAMVAEAVAIAAAQSGEAVAA